MVPQYIYTKRCPGFDHPWYIEYIMTNSTSTCSYDQVLNACNVQHTYVLCHKCYHKILYSPYTGKSKANSSPQFETKSVLGYGLQLFRNNNYQPLEFHVPQQIAVQIGALYPQWVSNTLQYYRHHTEQFLACF